MSSESEGSLGRRALPLTEPWVTESVASNQKDDVKQALAKVRRGASASGW